MVAFNEPMAELVRTHEKVVPSGHVPPVHVGVAEKVWLCVTGSVQEEGLTPTDERPGIMVMVAELSTVFPFNDALTNRPTVPMVLPAVKVTG
jgi:hypothetical protein